MSLQSSGYFNGALLLARLYRNCKPKMVAERSRQTALETMIAHRPPRTPYSVQTAKAEMVTKYMRLEMPSAVRSRKSLMS